MAEYGTIIGTAFGTTWSRLALKASRVSGPAGLALGEYCFHTENRMDNPITKLPKYVFRRANGSYRYKRNVPKALRQVIPKPQSTDSWVTATMRRSDACLLSMQKSKPCSMRNARRQIAREPQVLSESGWESGMPMPSLRGWWILSGTSWMTSLNLLRN